MTTLFVEGPDNVLLTPPPILWYCAWNSRQDLIETGNLADAGRLFVGSSLYGLIPAKLISVS